MANKHYYQFTVLDHSKEESGSKIHFGVVTALNLPILLTQLGNLRTSIENMIKGVIKKDMWVGDSTIRNNQPPTDPSAAVELKLRFDYEGATSKKRYRVEIPTADTSKLLENSDEVDLLDPEVAAFISAFEAIGRTPDDDAETINVLGGRMVGRNI
jgi:hypothetical protein